jgi:hypothetical protein
VRSDPEALAALEALGEDPVVLGPSPVMAVGRRLFEAMRRELSVDPEHPSRASLGLEAPEAPPLVPEEAADALIEALGELGHAFRDALSVDVRRGPDGEAVYEVDVPIMAPLRPIELRCVITADGVEHEARPMTPRLENHDPETSRLTPDDLLSVAHEVAESYDPPRYLRFGVDPASGPDQSAVVLFEGSRDGVTFYPLPASFQAPFEVVTTPEQIAEIREGIRREFSIGSREWAEGEAQSRNFMIAGATLAPVPSIWKALDSIDHKVRVEFWVDGQVVVKARGHELPFESSETMQAWVDEGTPGEERDHVTIRRLWRLLRDDPQD